MSPPLLPPTPRSVATGTANVDRSSHMQLRNGFLGRVRGIAAEEGEAKLGLVMDRWLLDTPVHAATRKGCLEQVRV